METVIGIDFMNSPIIPVERRSGRKAQTVVRVVVVSTTLKSFKTKRTASSGVYLPVRRYCLVAETTTIASSTKRPKAKISENIERKFKVAPSASITEKVAKKTSGMASPATKASLRPTIRKRIMNTKRSVSKKSWLSWLKSRSTNSAISVVVWYFTPAGKTLSIRSVAALASETVSIIEPPVLFIIEIVTASSGIELSEESLE